MSSSQINKKIEVPILARVEGEGALDLEIKDGNITKCHVRIYEPPRYFEKFLEGREPNEIIDAVARICGICPMAYQMSVVTLMERAFDVEVTPWVHSMRRVMYLAEWMESHYLHTHILAAPDFLKYHSAIEMAKDFPNEVKRGVRLQHLGNDILKLFGGRSVHPGAIKVGGFYRAPKQSEINALIVRLEEGLVDAENVVKWFSKLPYPDVEFEGLTQVALSDPTDAYPVITDQVVTSRGERFHIDQWDEYFHEFHAPQSTALHSTKDGKPYLTSPLSRFNLNFEKLPKEVKLLAESTGIQFPSNNIFHSILARSIECYYAIFEILRILRDYQYPDKPYVDVTYKAGKAWGASEAPRGIQIDYFEFDSKGRATKIRITPPTAQNLACMEADLRQSLSKFGLDRSDDELRQHAEMVIRNYDPCISCSAHFLTLNIKRS
ncbi:Ni/Fe hydrogenase subunit alpha [Fangia hongkongensis]|uniref:Ni/Fe hydrogenase subunit alpha n=1 Tax=Fangia hongkongensis TaxID=270495 RepID=UPI000380E366|nr:nickel-dependent hydrogenase large subunit [Fangia hongkongensis]MBK2125208.1 nickel-dependent hydrogenase large subunit [Fangia hongkongensis]